MISLKVLEFLGVLALAGVGGLIFWWAKQRDLRSDRRQVRQVRASQQRHQLAGSVSPREIWWAEVPFEDGPGAKDRPCLVLSVGRRSAEVVKITSKHHAERPGVLALPPGTVGDSQGRASWLETDELRTVPLTAFRRRVGPVDAQTWARTERAVRAR